MEALSLSTSNASSTTQVIQISPDDSFEVVLMALRLQPAPLILLLPERSQALRCPEHFTQLRQVREPGSVSFVCSGYQTENLAEYACQQGFSVASSLEEAIYYLGLHEEEREAVFQRRIASLRKQEAELHENPVIREDRQDHSHVLLADEPTMTSTAQPVQSMMSTLMNRSSSSSHTLFLLAEAKRRGFVVIFIAVLMIVGTVLVPILFSAQPGLISASHAALGGALPVGQAVFTSSGQLNPSSSQGLNDRVTIRLSHLSPPAPGASYYAWFLPDRSDHQTKPLLLGKLVVTGGQAQLTYMHPTHANMLTLWSRFLVTEQASQVQPASPSNDPATWRYTGSIPDIPTPGDEKRYSLLDHLHHLLAQDPTLQEICLTGGLDIWLYRNAGKILEWAGAARDDWAGGRQTALIHRQMIRIVDYLDGAATVTTSGDLPLDTPFLADPQAGRLGLLEVRQSQTLPAYLTHVGIHVLGVMNAPGHSAEQQRIAIAVEDALNQIRVQLQQVHQDAVILAKMDETQLRSASALLLLNNAMCKFS